MASRPAEIILQPPAQLIVPPDQPLTFCGALPSELGLAARGQMRWNRRQLTYCWIDRVPGLSNEQRDAATKWAFDQWVIASNGYFSCAPTTDSRTCNILLTSAQLDGSGRVLADMMLPPGDDRQLRGRFDSGEAWDRSVIFRLVLLHELGHAFGLYHIDNRQQASVLDSMYNSRLTKLQPLDIATLLRIYPEAANLPPIDAPPPVTPTPGPAPPTTPPFGPNRRKIVVTMDDGVFSGEVTRVL